MARCVGFCKLLTRLVNVFCGIHGIIIEVLYYVLGLFKLSVRGLLVLGLLIFYGSKLRTKLQTLNNARCMSFRVPTGP